MNHMIIKNVCLLAANTARSKAYIHVMVKENILPNRCIIYVNSKDELIKESEQYTDKKCEDYFPLEEPLLHLLQREEISWDIVENRDINSEVILNTLRQTEEEVIIFSGYGGQILKKPLFQIGKKYLHVHAGILPEYRGSTTAYYSYLQERTMGATAIFLNEGIDTGEIIISERFKVPLDDINIDYIYEPWTRAQVLCRALRIILKGNYETISQGGTNGSETYFIIHPLLKHIALLGMDADRKS